MIRNDTAVNAEKTPLVRLVECVDRDSALVVDRHVATVESRRLLWGNHRLVVPRRCFAAVVGPTSGHVVRDRWIGPIHGVRAAIHSRTGIATLGVGRSNPN